MKNGGEKMLDGFKQYNMSTGKSSVSITENGVSFSKACVIKMDKCPYVKLFIDETNRRIAIQKAQKEDDGSIAFYNAKKIISVRWNNKELLKVISKMMGWELRGNVFKADGDYIVTEEAMIFDLKDAVKTSPK